VFEFKTDCECGARLSKATLAISSHKNHHCSNIHHWQPKCRLLLGTTLSCYAIPLLPPRLSTFLVSVYFFLQFSHRWATGWTIGALGFDSRRQLGIFIFTTASRTALGPAQPPIKRVPGALSLGVKREADHSLPSRAEVKNAWIYISAPPIRLHGVVLSKEESTGTTLPFYVYNHCM
jgi:hypothetical protein